ncbi:MAG: HAD-IA family hydrolase [Propionibacteriaceae bacterium]
MIAEQPDVLDVDAILFDCDGVLVDSDASVVAAWSRWARAHDLDPSYVVGLVHGRRSADTVAALITADRRDAALAMVDQFEIDDAATTVAVPGAAELLATLEAERWAVVTSGLFPLATARLAAAGLPVPTVLITADRVRRGKPDPEGYLAGAAGLGVDPGRCVVLEDAPEGVAAARNAGVGAVVGVGPRVRDLNIDRHVDDLTTLTWTPAGLRVGRSPRPASPRLGL